MQNLFKGRTALVVALLSLGMLGLLGLIPKGEEPMAGLSLLRMGLALIAILALIRVAVPLLQGLNKQPGRKQARLRNESMLNLGGRLKVAIISVDGREFLVGIGGDRVTLLSELDDLSQEPFQGEGGTEFLERLEKIAKA
ncbi:flagellar biosynthetic protein FliO [bacterium]|nr:flagellar biosynthetic protein FliO [bacterium]